MNETQKRTSPKFIKSLVLPTEVKTRQKYFAVDESVHLYVSVTANGAKSFVFRKKHAGNWKTIDLACRFLDELDTTAQRLSIKAAQGKAADFTAQLSRGADPFTASKELQQDPTLLELFDHYRKGHLEKGAKRVDEAVNNFNRWFGHLAKRKASAFTWADANKLHEQMTNRVSKKTGCGTPYSANRAMQLGRAFFNFGLKTKVITGDNPFAGVSLNKEVARERFLSDEEAANLLNTVIDVPGRHCHQRTLYDFILLDMGLGVRKANLLSMRWDEIDERAWTWTIPASKMKGGKAMTIRLAPAEIAVLKDRREIHKAAGIVSPWVFPSAKSKSGHVVDPGNSWETLRVQLGMPDVTMHDLRRSLASAMINAGTDASIVQRALSHTDPRTTAKHYIRTTQQAEFDARQKVYEVRLQTAKRIPGTNVTSIQPSKKRSQIK